MRRMIVATVCGIWALGGVTAATADEGMWLFNVPPSGQLRDRYDFEPSAEWLDHVQRSCVRFGGNGSASIVSSHGLVMTNHHVGASQLQKLSTASHNLMKTGFYAAAQAEELRCHDLTVSVLQSIEDVTDRVTAAAPSRATPAVANAALTTEMSKIEAECGATSDLNCEIVTLFHGAQYHLYRYKNYDDVRLVMAPEQQIAFFGGDNDNFGYPRFNLDVCFFRIYENGKPIAPDHYLKWSKRGVSEGDLTIVAGHPFRTRRLYSVANLSFLRDVSYPTILKRLWRREVKLTVFSAKSADHARIANGDLKNCQNSRKAFTGSLQGLHDAELFSQRVTEEKSLRDSVAKNDDHQKKWGRAWERLKEAQAAHAAMYERFTAMEGRRRVFRSELLRLARILVRKAVEDAKPNPQRDELYRDANIERLEQTLYSQAEIDLTLEVHQLASAFSYFAETYGGRDRMTRVLLAGQSPTQRAWSLVHTTRVGDVEVRRGLMASGMSGIEASTDPMIRLAVHLETEVEALRRKYKAEVESVERAAYAKIAAAKFAVFGDNISPDATGSLRLAFGSARGYVEGDQSLPWQTTMEGAFAHSAERGAAPPYALPSRWLDRKDQLNLDTPFNFVTDVDVIGGNSGSPVVNRDGEVIGLVFDINTHALVWDTIYTSDKARTVAIDARAIVETLQKIYDAGNLVNEILNRDR